MASQQLPASRLFFAKKRRRGSLPAPNNAMAAFVSLLSVCV